MDKDPAGMRDIELLEAYSAYSRLGFRLRQEQNYLSTLRQEILKRMSSSREETATNEGE